MARAGKRKGAWSDNSSNPKKRNTDGGSGWNGGNKYEEREKPEGQISPAIPRSKRVIWWNKQIKDHGQNKRLALAVKAWDDMTITESLGPTAISYNVIIHACVRCGATDKALEYLHKLRQESNSGVSAKRTKGGRRLVQHTPKPTVITYTTILKGLCQNGDMQGAAELLNEMESEAKLQEQSNPSTETSMGGNIPAVVPVQSIPAQPSSVSASSSSLLPNLRTANMFLRGCLWSGNVVAGEELVRRLPSWEMVKTVFVLFSKKLLSSGIICQQQ
jgi:pentatricopeptide repeat protein